MTTPPAPKPDRIGSDVFVRDCEDPTAQMRARVFSIDYKTDEAELGFYPERGIQFSEIHLPDIYRATVPLADLSLDPLSGAAEFGYADIIRRGDKAVDLSYMDWTGAMRVPVIKSDDDGQPRALIEAEDAMVYTCAQCGPDANGSEIHALMFHTLPPYSLEQAKAEVAGEALPEFVPATEPANLSGGATAGGVPGHAAAMLVPDFPAHRENPNMAIGFMKELPPQGPHEGVQRAGGTAPLFTREEVRRKLDDVTAQLRHLEEMVKSME